MIKRKDVNLFLSKDCDLKPRFKICPSLVTVASFALFRLRRMHCLYALIAIYFHVSVCPSVRLSVAVGMIIFILPQKVIATT